MPRPSVNLRVGAIVAVRRRVLFGEGKDTLPTDANNSVHDLRVLAFTRKEINKRDTACVVLSHPSSSGSVFYAAAGSTRVLQVPDRPEGNASDNDDAAAAASGDVGEDMMPSSDQEHDEDDSDDEPPSPSPDDDPNPTHHHAGDDTPPSPHLRARTGSTYEFNRVLTALDIPNGLVRPQMHPRWHHGLGPTEFLSPAAAFTSLFPPDLLERMMLATNTKLVANGMRPVSKDELFAVIAGVMMISAFYSGTKRADLFQSSTSPVFNRTNLSKYISRRRVDDILAALTLSNTEPPPHHDPLFHVREMQCSFNNHMNNVFTPGSLTCLDESMVAYHNDDAPGWVFVRRKPHPHGFEYHTIADQETAVIFRMELVEGRFQPPQASPPTAIGSMAALLDRMTVRLRGKGHTVILDSAFCVIEGLVDLALKGVYAVAVVKKRKYWPRHVPGDAIISYMKDKPVGELHVAQGKVNNVQINFNCVRHSRYTFILASTYGSHNIVGEPVKLWSPSGGSFSVERNQVLSDYYAARHAVDDNNRTRQGTAGGIERAWGVKSWELRHLAFLVALCESNGLRLYNFFVARTTARSNEKLLEYRVKVAEDLLEALITQDEVRSSSRALRRRSETQHYLISIPVFRGAWNGRGYNKTKFRYQKVACKGDINPRTGLKCTALVRTVCVCTPGLFLCKDCIVQHIYGVDT